MVEAYKHSGPVTANEVVKQWMTWCEANDLPIPEFVLLDVREKDSDEALSMEA